jgi:3-hydroxybutyryl-CoA dehydratase
MSHVFSLDFDELCEGTRFEGPWRTISEADVARFAALTGDHHPQHTDSEWAATSLFGERVAHGLLVLSCAAGLLAFDPDRVLALRSVRSAIFKRPVRLGESIRVEGRVRKATLLDRQAGLVEVGLNVYRFDGRLVLRGIIELVWKRDAYASEQSQAVASKMGLD